MQPEETKELIENSENLTTTYIGTRDSHLGIEESVGIDDVNRSMHTLCIGPTGSGKTQLAVHVALQDCEKGHGVCFINPKGDAIDQILRKLPEDRIEDVVYLNPNKEPVTKINVLEPHIAEDMTQAQLEHQKEIIVSDLVDLFRRYSKEWGDRFGRVLETLLRAHLDLNIRYDEHNTLLDVYEAVIDENTLLNLIDRTDNQYIRNQLLNIRQLSERELEPLHRRLDDFVQNDTVRRVIDAGESGIDFREVVNDGKILLVDVQKGHIGKTSSEILGSIVTTQVWAAAQSRISLPTGQRKPFHVLVDEVHTFGGEGSSFAKILAEAREYRLCLQLLSQYLNQLEPEMRRAVTNNCRTKIFFNPSGSEDVSKIAGMLQGVDKRTLTALGQYRAVLQQPQNGERNGAITFNTLPPWDTGRDDVEIEKIKRQATVAKEEEKKEAALAGMMNLGPGGNAGEQLHSMLLRQAKQYLEQRPEVARVNLLHQDIGAERPDGEIIKQNGKVANLEAEVSTLANPAKVLTNLKRAAESGRKTVFVVQQEMAARLENIVTSPVREDGEYYMDDGEPFTDIEVLEDAEYRILVRTKRGKIMDYAKGSDADCPKLDEYDKQELVVGCPWREVDMCSLLDAPCVFHDELAGGAA